MIYFILLILTITPLFLIEEGIFGKDKDNTDLIRLFFIVSVVLLILVSIFRSDSVGIDFKYYLHYYIDDNRKFEIGYLFVTDLFRSNNLEFSQIKLLFSIVFPLFFGTSFYLISEKKWFSLLLFQTLYLYVSSFSLLRQYIAIVFVLISMIFLKHFLNQSDNKRKYLSYIISVLLIVFASLFHYSAIAMLILPVIALVERRYYLIVVYLILGLVMFVFREPLFTFILTTLFPTKVNYLNFTPEVGIIPTIQLILVLVSQIVYRINVTELVFQKKEREYLFLTNLSIIWLITMYIFSWFPNIARINMYIFSIVSAFLPNFLLLKKKTYIIIILILIVYYAYSLFVTDYQGVYPYQWIFEASI